MSNLKTYDRLDSHYVRSFTSTIPATKLSPGALVSCDYGNKTFGILVAVKGKNLTVLWSIAPQIDPIRYDPLSIDEEIFIPVTCQSGPNCPGCMGANCAGLPIKPIKQIENAGWFTKQYRRIFGKK